MKKSRAYLIPVHKNAYDPGVPGHIMGIKFIKPESLTNEEYEYRPCYHLQYDLEEDIKYDFVPMQDVIDGHYKMVSGLELKKQNKL